ncbi:hypothetical protein BATDEDRAFT_90581 [Batrachochytrium dendrobatidis JAM81]|uniref:Acyl-CoA thioesterase 2 C-terminal domain-containing protein n=1 Tax=Batrachochytrium dendrobatidis (strain JAM81 / FGSC 10211) TaxID=684364 RepID=F4P7Z7_BATDJ|nr:uncharacterized protein BATDEDRAFT_90581 [Batrachochytrium dendrobatidis JAM81]EGF78662.1 hypothetical protein BATDEDRAFT_90581 [Batrachochytrium dendrobatidis JAM81]|eukprot:XP_006680933.1 hypothetical protein BATDEDRAFT_90581 [Batrachochytrium dendrobatidis JAM81]
MEDSAQQTVAPIELALDLEYIDSNLYRSKQLWTPAGNRGVFGGQVVGLALSAAAKTVDSKFQVHVRKSYASRTVTARQRGRVIFMLMCSFQVEEFSPLAHQYDMPNVPLPESLKSTEQRLREWLEDPRAEKYHKTIQMRLEQHELLNTSLIPHGLARLGGHRKLTMLTSLDHAIWFHAPFRADEWLLYVMESPRSIGGRGFAHGRVYTQDGRLVMSTAQEGVVRVNTSPKTDESEPLATGKFTPLKYTVSAKI